MRYIGICIALGPLLATLPGASEAQVTLSPYAGAMIYDGSLAIYEDGVRQGSGIENRAPVPVVGLRVGYRLSPRWSTELSYGRSWLENSRGDLASHLVHAMLQYSLVRSGHWSAHLDAGGGGIVYRSASPESNSLSDAMVAGGIGAAYRLTPAVEVRADLRLFGQFCKQEDGRQGPSCNDGSQLGYSELSGGVRIRL